MSSGDHWQLRVDDLVRLTLVRETDNAVYAYHLEDSEICHFTILTPVAEEPLITPSDWLAVRLAQNAEQCAYFALRAPDDELIGAVGVPAELGADQPSAEIGYWLARRWRGQGIMPAALRVYCRHVFGRHPSLRQLTATPFSDNHASARALEKAGFVCEGMLPAHYLRNGRRVDALAFRTLAERWQLGVGEGNSLADTTASGTQR